MSDSIFESVMREVMDRYSFLIKEDSDGKNMSLVILKLINQH